MLVKYSKNQSINHSIRVIIKLPNSEQSYKGKVNLIPYKNIYNLPAKVLLD